MKKRTKISIIFLTGALLLTIGAFLLSAKLTSDFKKSMSGDAHQQEQVRLHGFVITETKEGIKYWEIYAKEGEYDSSKTNAKLYEPIGNYYKEGKVVLSFAAPVGSYNSETKEVKLSGGAYVVTENDNRVKADEISWLSSTDIINATGHVKVFKDKDFIAMGDKARIDTKFTNLEIMENTIVEVYKDKKGKEE